MVKLDAWADGIEKQENDLRALLEKVHPTGGPSDPTSVLRASEVVKDEYQDWINGGHIRWVSDLLDATNIAGALGDELRHEYVHTAEIQTELHKILDELFPETAPHRFLQEEFPHTGRKFEEHTISLVWPTYHLRNQWHQRELNRGRLDLAKARLILEHRIGFASKVPQCERDVAVWQQAVDRDEKWYQYHIQEMKIVAKHLKMKEGAAA
jgi:hypothetical protein